MSRDSGGDQPTQRTVAELLAEYGNSNKGGSRRRRRRAEDPTETAPQAIIDRVLSDSGQMRAVDAEAEPPQRRSHRPGAAPTPPVPPTPKNTGAPAPPEPAAPQPAGPQPAAPQPGAPETGGPQQSAPAQPSGAPQVGGPQSGGEQPPAQQTPVPPTAEPAQAEDDEAAPGSANYWAQRFAAAGQGPAAPAPQSSPAPAESDAEVTLQQPALPRRPSPHPAPPAPPKPAPPVEGATEQLPKVQAEEVAAADEEGTAVLAYPPPPAPAEEQEKDPYDFDSYDEDFDPYDEADDEYGSYGTRRESEGERYDDYDEELPAGLDSEDYRAGDDEPEEEPSAGKEWATLAVQCVAGLLGGGLVWLSFRWLWINVALAALVAALVITGCLVFIARKFLRSDDLQTILLAVLVGLVCTVSPAALLLIGH
ncbi:hypothetical protein [Saccharopolyspora sp. CA-218241]|uniref:hypothetical protein n=1 Tax=Saccharopolyspora sp. CA-218241 TaxID=3240027 RepID=UPI003D9915DC